MPHHVCPWYVGYLLACPLRRLHQNPIKILAPFVRPGMTVLEPGPGMGFFTLDLARLVGPAGLVYAVDIQTKMLRSLERRARRAGLQDLVRARLTEPDSLGVSDLAGRVDFALAFALVHETPSASFFFHQVGETLKPGGLLLFAEPKGHVTDDTFRSELAAAESAGFTVVDHPVIRRSNTALLKKT